MTRVSQMPCIVVIHYACASRQQRSFQPRREPRKCFFFNPQQVVAFRADQLTKSTSVGLDQRRKGNPLPAVEPVDIVVIGKRSDRNLEPCSLERREIMIVSNA